MAAFTLPQKELNSCKEIICPIKPKIFALSLQSKFGDSWLKAMLEILKGYLSDNVHTSLI